MPRRALKPCAEPGCLALVPSGTTRCARHRRKAWGRRATPKPRRMSRPKWERLKQLVLARDRGVCHICGEPGANTADHVIALGGTDEPSNLRAAHRRCNQCKAGAEAHESRRQRRAAE